MNLHLTITAIRNVMVLRNFSSTLPDYLSHAMRMSNLANLGRALISFSEVFLGSQPCKDGTDFQCFRNCHRLQTIPEDGDSDNFWTTEVHSVLMQIISWNTSLHWLAVKSSYLFCLSSSWIQFTYVEFVIAIQLASTGRNQ
jgi:hypothetical protein